MTSKPYHSTLRPFRNHWLAHYLRESSTTYDLHLSGGSSVISLVMQITDSARKDALYSVESEASLSKVRSTIPRFVDDLMIVRDEVHRVLIIAAWFFCHVLSVGVSPRRGLIPRSSSVAAPSSFTVLLNGMDRAVQQMKTSDGRSKNWASTAPDVSLVPKGTPASWNHRQFLNMYYCYYYQYYYHYYYYFININFHYSQQLPVRITNVI